MQRLNAIIGSNSVDNHKQNKNNVLSIKNVSKYPLFQRMNNWLQRFILGNIRLSPAFLRYINWKFWFQIITIPFREQKHLLG